MKGLWILMIVIALVCLIVGFILGLKWNVPDLIDEISGKKAERQIKTLKDLHSGKDSLDNVPTKEVNNVSSGNILTSELKGIDEELESSIGEKSTTKDLLEDLDYRNDGPSKNAHYDKNEDEPTSLIDRSEDSDDEVPTDLLDSSESRVTADEDIVDEEEQPTGILNEKVEEDEDDSLTDILSEDEEDELPTGVLSEGDEEDLPTGILSEDDGEDKTSILEDNDNDLTSYAGGDEDVATSFLDESDLDDIDELRITILEEQSSL